MKTLDAPLLTRLAAEFGTPAYVYDAAVIRDRIRQLRSFDTIRFAQKACSNVHLLRLMREEGVLVDSVSGGEIERALVAGYLTGEEPSSIVFTADLFDRATLDRVVQLGIPVNAGSPDMLEQLGQRSPGHRVWIRVNPGFGHGHSRKTNTGGESSKHGIWHENLAESLEIVRRHDLRLVGLHMHIGSGADFHHLKSVCDAMVEQVKVLGQDLEAISAGGGLPIPYRLDGMHVDCDEYFRLWDAARKAIEAKLGHSVRLEIEPGRFLVAESGVLLSEVRAVKDQGSNHFVLVDAGFNDLVRPAMYGSWHEVSFLRSGAKVVDGIRPTLLAGPLCESGDVFTQEEGGVVVPRELPQARVGDLAVLHDTGAYGAAMASNYNSRGLLPEILVDTGKVRLIRRRQTIRDLLALEESVIGLLLLLCSQSDSLPPVWGATETIAAVGTIGLASALLPLDQPISRFAHSHHDVESRNWAVGSKFFGSGYALPIPVGLFLIGKFDGAPRLERASQNAMEAWVITQLVVQSTKYGFHRHRPSSSSSAFVFDGPSISNNDAYLSFPSGHSASAWGLLPAYAMEYSDHPWLAAALYAVAASTSLSRVHDNEHWTSDVVVSAGVGWIANRMVRAWNLRRASSVALVPELDDRVGIRLVWTP